MAVITHLCTKCHHPDYRRKAEGGGSCPNCPCGSCKPGKPELRPTFDIASRPVERIITPGEAIGIPSITACPCDVCMALYGQLTGAGDKPDG